MYTEDGILAVTANIDPIACSQTGAILRDVVQVIEAVKLGIRIGFACLIGHAGDLNGIIGGGCSIYFTSYIKIQLIVVIIARKRFAPATVLQSHVILIGRLIPPDGQTGQIGDAGAAMLGNV